MTAKYLIRIDDICNGFNLKNFLKIKKILIKYKINPILAVIANNKDQKLIYKKKEKDYLFWRRIYFLQSKLNWTIGIHGYNHVYENINSGILKLNNYSEFAGLSLKKQNKKIIQAINIFKKNKIFPKLFIAPAHSFDLNTLKVLKKNKLDFISDGFFIHPGHDKNHLFWIPQQLWKFKKKFIGVWTVNYHINDWKKKDFSLFEKDLKKFSTNIISFDEVILKYKNRHISNIDKLYSKYFIFKNKIIEFLVKFKKSFN